MGQLSGLLNVHLVGLAAHEPGADERGDAEEEGERVEGHLGRRVPRLRQPPVQQLKNKPLLKSAAICLASKSQEGNSLGDTR